ncbi:PDR/VanB family oxidoreductase [Thalassovita taeanensis]|uniref:Vanillate O-demethylase ferredoxin subunit n=1 Tax=Thalassovita taeanensis TaxID=657014 RepID=A0A1H9J670_9RHOB|nr:PDR/VanB family oxidoreductase [Thalassovita taeanensis]SEQ82288.1 vanillate O-demethylase ferredoxin subunit [Thalassovita taeanensis]
MTHTNSLVLTVAERIDDLGDIMRLTLKGEGDLPPFAAGAHIDVQVETPEGPIWRQYSLCGEPGKSDAYHLGILRDPESRGGSVTLHDLMRAGEKLHAEGPRNHFPLAEGATRSILFGGGIGVTPMLAMAWELHRKGQAFTLHYATRSADRTAFLDVIKAAPFRDHIVLHHDDGEGAAPINLARDLPAAEPGCHVYVCGPQGFMDWIISAAECAGYASNVIHREYFSADVDAHGESFEVFCAQSGIAVTVGPDDTIAKSLVKAGIKIDVKCEEGICGTCVTDVLEGEIDHRDKFLTEEEREEGDQICACCSRARGARLVLDI